MTPQLDWHRANDCTLRTACGRYEIKRQLSYENHPATEWEYIPKCNEDPGRVIGTGKYSDSKFARQACQDDIDQQQRLRAASTIEDKP